MKRATIGVWINYLTTTAFQVAFAIEFGGGAAAALFVLTFSLVLFLGGIGTASTQALLVPRLLTIDGRLNAKTLRYILYSSMFVLLLLSLVAATANWTAPWLAGIVNGNSVEVASALRAGCLFMFLNVVATQLLSCLLTLGKRIGPAAAPAFPSIVGTLSLVFADPSPSQLLLALAGGALLEILFLVALIPAGASIGTGAVSDLRLLAVITVVQLSLSAALPFTDRLLAGLDGPSGVAHYNYASRSIGIAQQLLIGGVILAVLGQWSSLASRLEWAQLHRAISRSVLAAAILLSSAAAVGLVLAESLVGLIYQHGAFTSADTDSVALLVRVTLVGFVAEGIGLILSQALLTSRRNWAALSIGFGNVALRVALSVCFAVPFGVVGVAVAYSLTAALVLVVQLWVVFKMGSFSFVPFASRARLFWSASATIGGALALDQANWGSAWVRGMLLAAFLLVLYRAPVTAMLRDAQWTRSEQLG